MKNLNGLIKSLPLKKQKDKGFFYFTSQQMHLRETHTKDSAPFPNLSKRSFFFPRDGARGHLIKYIYDFPFSHSD